MPSTTSSSVSMLLLSSIVMTPSFPTFFMASAILAPISVSPFEEMVPTWAISSLDVTFLALAFSSSTTVATAWSIPRLRSMGLAPAATDLAPSRMMACARTVAVVVPSPATSEVFEATSLSIWAPIFSNLSSSSISLATVTPSFVMRGAPKDFSMTTLRPLGPSVTFTALARISTPRNIRSRASCENLTSLAVILDYSRNASEVLLSAGSGGCLHGGFTLDNAEDVALLQASAVGDHADRLADGYRLHFISPIGQMIFCQRYCPIAALEGGNFRTSESLTRMLLPSTRFFGGENF